MDPAAAALAITAIGLIAGVIGGLTGLGGSIIMLPGLALVLGYADESHVEQHLYMAAAMAVNFLVAVPATWRHQRAGAIDKRVVVRLVPPALVALLLGVQLSNKLDPQVLIYTLAVMIVVFVVIGEASGRLKHDDANSDEPLSTRRAWAIAGTGGFTGLIAGLLGIGGGVVMVASLRAVGGLRVKAAIASSATAMCVMAPIGAAMKIATLPQHDIEPLAAIRIIGLLGPAAIIGALIGSTLVHKLPRFWVRLAVNVVLLLAAARLADLL